jgi:hypothetical protein
MRANTGHYPLEHPGLPQMVDAPLTRSAVTERRDSVSLQYVLF